MPGFLSQCDPGANGIDTPCWNTSAPSSGVTSCSTASISSIESSSDSAVNYSDFDLARGYSLGAADYILSPIVPEILRAKATG